jgi:hypothetical protein
MKIRGEGEGRARQRELVFPFDLSLSVLADYPGNHERKNSPSCLQVDTPDSVLQSGLGLGPDMGHTILRSMVDPRDYDRLRYLQMNGGQPNSFEETINRVSVSDILSDYLVTTRCPLMSVATVSRRMRD